MSRLQAIRELVRDLPSEQGVSGYLLAQLKYLLDLLDRTMDPEDTMKTSDIRSKIMDAIIEGGGYKNFDFIMTAVAVEEVMRAAIRQAVDEGLTIAGVDEKRREEIVQEVLPDLCRRK